MWCFFMYKTEIKDSKKTQRLKLITAPLIK